MTFIIVVCLGIYIMYLTSRVNRLERILEGKNPIAHVAANVAQAPAAPVASPMPIQAPAPLKPTDLSGSHDFINFLPKVGVVALLFGLGFFLKYSIDQGWVSVELRLAIGALVGLGMLILYYYWKDKYSKYSITLAAGGIAIWYLTVFAAVQMYNLIDPITGLIILTAISIGVLILSKFVKSQTLQIIAWLGAYLAPLILGLGDHSYNLTLAYLVVVSIAIFINSIIEKNNSSIAIALIGAMFNLVMLKHGDIVGPGLGLPVITYLSAHFLVGLIFTCISLREISEQITITLKREYMLLFSLIMLIFGTPLVYLVHYNYPDYATLILVAMSLWSFICYALVDRQEIQGVNYILAGAGAILLSIAAMWEFGSYGQVFVLYLLGLLGLVVGRARNRPEIRIYGLLEIIFGLILAIGISHEPNAALFISDKFGIELLGIAMLVVSYFFFAQDNVSEFEKDAHTGIQYIISAALMLFVSLDLINFYHLPTQMNERNLSLSIWWLILAVIMIALSVVKNLRALRKPSLILFGLVILKVFLYDLQTLETLYRIISFITLGVILLGVSFAYQRNKEKIKQYLDT